MTRNASDSSVCLKIGRIYINALDALWLIFLCLMSAHYSVRYIPMLFICAITLCSIMVVWRKSSFGFIIDTNAQKLFILYFIFFMWVVASNVWVVNPRIIGVDVESEMIRLLMLIFSMNVYCCNWDKYKKMMYMILFSTAYFAVIYLATSPIETYGTTLMGGITDIWRNTASYMGGLVGLMGLYLLGETKSKFNKTAVAVGTVICFALTLCTGSRKGMIQIGLYLILYMLLQKGITKRIKAIVIVLISFVVICFLIQEYSYLSSAYIDRMLGLVDTGVDDGSVAQRTYFREVAIMLFKERPLIGCGIDAVRSYLSKINYFHVTYAHNNMVELLADYGLIGFILYYWYPAKQTVYAFFHRNDTRFVMIAVIALVTMFVCDYGMMSYYIRQNLFLLFFLLKGLDLHRELSNFKGGKNCELS